MISWPWEYLATTIWKLFEPRSTAAMTSGILLEDRAMADEVQVRGGAPGKSVVRPAGAGPGLTRDGRAPPGPGYIENDEPQPQVVVAFGFLITNWAPSRSSR